MLLWMLGALAADTVAICCANCAISRLLAGFSELLEALDFTVLKLTDPLETSSKSVGGFISSAIMCELFFKDEDDLKIGEVFQRLKSIINEENKRRPLRSFCFCLFLLFLFFRSSSLDLSLYAIGNYIDCSNIVTKDDFCMSADFCAFRSYPCEERKGPERLDSALI